MQICKINNKSCSSCSKETNECFSIENCQHKIPYYLNQTKLDKVMGEMMEEKCTKCNGCLDCGFRGAWFCTVGTL